MTDLFFLCSLCFIQIYTHSYYTLTISLTQCAVKKSKFTVQHHTSLVKIPAANTQCITNTGEVSWALGKLFISNLPAGPRNCNQCICWLNRRRQCFDQVFPKHLVRFHCIFSKVQIIFAHIVMFTSHVHWGGKNIYSLAVEYLWLDTSRISQEITRRHNLRPNPPSPIGEKKSAFFKSWDCSSNVSLIYLEMFNWRVYIFWSRTEWGTYS